MQITLTKEQENIINCKLHFGDVLKIVAGAGTGKTSTLIEYAKARPERRMLYLCFNKSVQLEASKKFPSNVECRTGHSLAWHGFGSKYRDKLVPGLKVYSVKNSLGIQSYEATQAALDTLNNFLHSADDYITTDHVPKKFSGDVAGMAKKAISSVATDIWSRMIDEQDSSIGMLHDGYLKLWQVSYPQLRYDIILLDEAQDTNQTLAHVFFNQKSAIKVLVGDAHQQIYSFRGSRNFMQNIDATKTFMLSQSFRFHDGIADIANTILTTLKNERDLKIVGSAKKTKKISKQMAIIARTNAGIFDGAASRLEDLKLAYVGGAKNYKFSMIHDVYRLSVNAKHEISDKYISSFGDYKTLTEYAQSAEDRELLGVIGVVKKYGREIPFLINEIFNQEVDEQDADVIFVTAHKSKGLEWDHVVLMDDFKDYYQDGQFQTSELIDPDEINLAYVATTRAKQILEYGPSFSNFLREAKRHAV